MQKEFAFFLPPTRYHHSPTNSMDISNQKKAFGHHSSNDLPVKGLNALKQTLQVWVLPAVGEEVTGAEFCSAPVPFETSNTNSYLTHFHRKHQNKSDLELSSESLAFKNNFEAALRSPD